MLVVGPVTGRPAPVGVDQWVMAKGLEEDRFPCRLQRSRELRRRSVQIEVMDDARSANEVERVVLELEAFCVHDSERDVRELARARLFFRAADSLRRDVDAGHACPTLCEHERAAALPASVLEHVGAWCR